MESDLYSLRVTDVFRLNLENCNFYQNINPLIIINTYMNKIDISIVKCLFENNFSLQNGGAILIRGESAVYESTLLIDNVKFIKNVAKQNGGALYVDLPMKIITINNCEFSYNKIDNKNLQQQQIVTQNEIGNGGAIYLNGIQYLVEFYNTIAFNNSAIRGGVIYTNSPIELNKENFFYNNEANCGGVLFSNNLKNLQKINNSGISNNLGIYYGNNVASFASFINFTINNDTIEIYPGQEFTIEITTFDLMNQEIKFLNEPFTKSEFLNNNFKLETLNSANGIYKFKILQSLNEEKLNLENLNQIKFNTLHSERILNIIVKDCPNNFIKDEQFNYFICKRKEFPLSVIIIISVISSSILSIFLFIIFTYCCINITTKLRKLKLKENAEKDIERKILDNKIVFGVSSSSSYSTTTQKQSSSLDTPLLQQSDGDENNYYNKDIYTTNNSNSSTIKKKLLKSFIIPVEQIKIEKKIGEGGCGTVYLATWGANKVAIKSIKLTNAEDDNEENNNEDFEREVTLLSQLRHPNIVTFFGVTITEYSKYMVIEYLSKGSLKQTINDCKLGKINFTFLEKLNILIGIAEGMKYLHNLKPNPILHRDLKSDNILLDQFGNCKVCDFGLSKIISNSAQTMTTNVGTLFYLAPEMLNNNCDNDNNTNLGNTITSKLDVYSYSIIMWELFFEEIPYTKSSKKLNYFSHNQNHKQIDNLFIIPSLVLKGLRPFIPFTNKEEKEIWIREFICPFELLNSNFEKLKLCIDRYLELMINCWNENPNSRPCFIEISNQLMEMKTLIAY